MLILTIRTDKPEAEIGFYDGNKKLAYETWQAHRQLAETIHHQIAKNLRAIDKDWPDVKGIVCFKGPGSFTGLRIGLSVANALAYVNNIPITGTTGNHWLEDGLGRLVEGQGDKAIMPEYGADPHITQPRK